MGWGGARGRILAEPINDYPPLLHLFCRSIVEGPGPETQRGPPTPWAKHTLQYCSASVDRRGGVGWGGSIWRELLTDQQNASGLGRSRDRLRGGRAGSWSGGGVVPGRFKSIRGLLHLHVLAAGLTGGGDCVTEDKRRINAPPVGVTVWTRRHGVQGPTVCLTSPESDGCSLGRCWGLCPAHVPPRAAR